MTTATHPFSTRVARISRASIRFQRNNHLGFNAGDHNLYRYVANGPSMYTDPSGLQAPGSGPASSGTSGGAGQSAAGTAGRPPILPAGGNFINDLIKDSGITIEGDKARAQYETDDGTKINGEVDKNGNGNVRLENGNNSVEINRNGDKISLDATLEKGGHKYEIHIKEDGSVTFRVDGGKSNPINDISIFDNFTLGTYTVHFGNYEITISGKNRDGTTSGSLTIDRHGGIKGGAKWEGFLGDGIKGGIYVGEDGDLGFGRNGTGIRIGSRPRGHLPIAGIIEWDPPIVDLFPGLPQPRIGLRIFPVESRLRPPVLRGRPPQHHGGHKLPNIGVEAYIEW